jgi:hypothetical protein
MMSFAIAPAIRPRQIQDKIPMRNLQDKFARAVKDLFFAVILDGVVSADLK